MIKAITGWRQHGKSLAAKWLPVFQRFYDLPSERRIDILIDMGILERSERYLPWSRRISRGFQQVVQQGLYDEIRTRIDAHHNRLTNADK